MGLSEEGIKTLKKMLLSRVDESNVDRVALLMSSNATENFFGVCVVHSEGKHLNLDQTDQWEMILWIVICKLSNDHFAESLTRRLGVGEEHDNELQRKQRARILKTKQKDKICLSSEPAKASRKRQKMLRDLRTGKENAKDSHITDKVSPKEGGKGRTAKKRKAKTTPTCSKCGMKGHTMSQGCPYPRKKASVGRGKENKPKLIDWSV